MKKTETNQRNKKARKTLLMLALIGLAGGSLFGLTSCYGHGYGGGHHGGHGSHFGGGHGGHHGGHGGGHH